MKQFLYVQKRVQIVSTTLHLSSENDDTASFLDLLFSEFRDESSLDNDRLGKATLTEDLTETVCEGVNNWNQIALLGL